jgi:predicted transcriptional regulator
MNKRDRNVNLNVRVHPDELAKLHALAEDRDLSASTFIRHAIKAAYEARFGNAPPQATTQTPEKK